MAAIPANELLLMLKYPENNIAPQGNRSTQPPQLRFPILDM